ncbi:MAG: ATP-binding protein [Alphaproteobacteria bacterium]
MFDLLGPDGKRLIAIERRIGRHIEGSDRAIRILVAMDEDELYEARLTFLEWLVGSLSFLGVVLILGAWMFLAYAFLPFAELRRALTDLHTGSVRRIDGMFPDEVQPLVEDLNRVLANRDEDLQRAQSRAADLAHGLKTPLAVISATARDLRARGFELAANEVEEEVARMDRYVRLELTRARAGLLANQVGQSSPAASILRKIVRAIGQISESVVQIDLTADENIVVGIAEQDLMEIAGNLIENAAKWAKTRVIVSVKRAGEDILIIVEDDGTGLPDPIGVIDFQRGRRLDESKPGTGLGLAIVKDICDAYNCRLSFDRSTLGGLRATVYVAEMAT